MDRYLAACSDLSKKRDAVERLVYSLRAGTMTSQAVLEFNELWPAEMLAEKTVFQKRPKPVGKPFADLF
ncbi:MAG: hypothetical protein LAO55_02010 [Acidobacteriia bacterium]|nr:hypothetical protein [Terriglobia bacterium]